MALSTNSITSDPNTARTPPGTPAVMQVLPALEAGGVERGTVDVTAALTAAGWRAIVASSGGPMVREILRAGGVHVQLPLNTRNPLRFRANARAITEAAREHQVSLIHARSRAPAWSAVGAARALKLPFVTTFHGTYSHGNPLKRYYNSVMLRGDRVIAISNFIAEHIREVYKVDEAKLVTIPRGVDVATFDPAAVHPHRIARLSKAWRLADDAHVILMPARLARWKGHQTVIEALPLLQREDVCCVFVGSAKGRDSYVAELDRLVRANKLEHKVRFVDHELDMPAAYMMAAVVVSASTDPEAFGRVAAEAQAMGRPVIATDHGGARETVVPGETGWLVPPRDPPALAAAISHALSLSPEMRHIAGSRARAHIIRNFSLEGMCSATLSVYRELLGR